MANPVIAELIRGELLESSHAGALAIAHPTGELVVAFGDVRRPIYPRSAIKALQCLPLIETGAADRFSFGNQELALACASHSGADEHVAVAGAMLARAGLDLAALGCGAHEPLGVEAAQQLMRLGRAPTALNNNCSGKHAGMLATAVHHGETTAGYTDPRHPVQQRIAAVLEAFTSRSIAATEPGIDGCSAPNWAIPLADLATAFARLGSGDGLQPARRGAVERIRNACWAEPLLVAGNGRLDTVLLGRFPGRLFLKTGAEGVYCGAIPGRALGFALKIDDGAKRASEIAVQALIARLLPEASSLPSAVGQTNWTGLDVAELRCSQEYVAALERCRPV